MKKLSVAERKAVSRLLKETDMGCIAYFGSARQINLKALLAQYADYWVECQDNGEFCHPADIFPEQLVDELTIRVLPQGNNLAYRCMTKDIEDATHKLMWLCGEFVD